MGIKMSEINDGGPAHPVESHNQVYSGMSLRDWLAGQAMAGLDTITISTNALPEIKLKQGYKGLAKHCVDVADAMILELERTDDDE